MNINWQALEAIAEVVGALAVVISILYLARSVEDSASTSRRTANHDLLEAANPAFIALAADERMAAVWARGLVDFGALTAVERIRFSALLLNIVYMWEEAYHAAQGGQVDAFALARTTGPRQELASMPGFRAWWQLRRGWFGPDFREFMDGQVSGAGELPPMYRGPAGSDAARESARPEAPSAHPTASAPASV